MTPKPGDYILVVYKATCSGTLLKSYGTIEKVSHVVGASVFTNVGDAPWGSPSSYVVLPGPFISEEQKRMLLGMYTVEG